MSVFAAIVSGRLPQSFEQVGPTQFSATITDADKINHVVVFFTGTVPFPPGMGALVYFSWPDPNGPPTWQLLGYLAEDKPSAIFKINDLKKEVATKELVPALNTDSLRQQLFSHSAQIGISIEPLLYVRQQSALTAMKTAESHVQFCQKMLENFMNYMSSFSVTQGQMTPDSNDTFVPLSVLQKWYITFERRLQQNPNFWRN